MKEIKDERSLEQIRRFASELVQHVTAIRASAANDLGWSVVPVESGAHFDDDDAERIAAAIRASGNDAIVAIATESLVAEPPGYRVPATGHGLREFSQRCGHFNYLLVPEDEEFAILCTVDDYYLVAGPENFVRCAVGGDIERAQREFQDFAGDPVWSEDARRNLLSIAAQYQTS